MTCNKRSATELTRTSTVQARKKAKHIETEDPYLFHSLSWWHSQQTLLGRQQSLELQHVCQQVVLLTPRPLLPADIQAHSDNSCQQGKASTEQAWGTAVQNLVEKVMLWLLRI